MSRNNDIKIVVDGKSYDVDTDKGTVTPTSDELDKFIGGLTDIATLGLGHVDEAVSDWFDDEDED